MALSKETIDRTVDRYWREFDRYVKLSEFVGEACRQLLDQNVIRGSVQWRAKNPERLRTKLEKWLANGEHEEEFTDLDSVFSVLKDLAGARVTTYVEDDRKRVVAIIQKRFDGVRGSEVEPDPKDTPGNHYRATHCLVSLKPEDLVGRYQNLEGLACELQVCSLLAHVFNEIEHDLGYKPLSGKLSQREQSLLDGLGHLVTTGDILINQTLDAVAERQKKNVDRFEDEYDFVTRMRPSFPDATNFAANAGQLYEVCVKLELDSPKKIKLALGWEDNVTATAAFNQAKSLAEKVAADSGQLEVDPLSSDQLLVLLLEDDQRVEKLKELYPSGRGIGRAPRFLSVAKRMMEASDQ